MMVYWLRQLKRVNTRASLGIKGNRSINQNLINVNQICEPVRRGLFLSLYFKMGILLSLPLKSRLIFFWWVSITRRATAIEKNR
jgi:hypothetical protein